VPRHGDRPGEPPVEARRRPPRPLAARRRPCPPRGGAARAAGPRRRSRGGARRARPPPEAPPRRRGRGGGDRARRPRAGAPGGARTRRQRAPPHAGRHPRADRRARPVARCRGRRPGHPARASGAGVRTLQSSRRLAGVGHRPRPRDCARARAADGRLARARVAAGPHGLHAAAAGVFTGKRGPGYSPLVRTAAIALACAALGGAAALGIGSAAGLVGADTETVVVREAPPPVSSPAAVRTALPAGPQRFAPARIYAHAAAGVVTVFSYFGGTAAQGSGFVVSRAGTILTNAHVVTNAGETAGRVRAADSVVVEFADHDRVPARIVGWDVYDVVGEPVAAVGSPLGNADSLATGIVSAVHRSIASLTAPSFQLIDAIQTDATIAHGSSGGPLLDAAGRVIGITAQLRSDQGGPSGVGFAVPIDAARRSLHDLLTKGHVAYAFAGLETENLTPALAAHLRLHVSHGALVDRAEPGGPAAEAGIRGGASAQQFEGQTVRVGGDVVVAIDGLPVASADDLVRIVTNRLRPGETALFTIVRAGRRRAVPVTLVARAPG